MFSGLEQLYFATGAIGFIYIVGSAMMGHMGEHGHGAHGHGAHGHAHGLDHGGGEHFGAHVTGGHSASLSHGGHPALGHGSAAGHGGAHGGGHGPAAGHGGHGSTSTGGAHSGSSHGTAGHGTHGHTHNGHADGEQSATKSELATTFSGNRLPRDKSSAAFFTIMRFVNPMRLALITFGFGFFGYVFLKTLPFLGALTILPAVVVAIGSSNLFLGLLGKFVGRLEKSDSYRKEDAIGTVGQLTVPIFPGATGEVTFVSSGGKTAAPAKAMSADSHINKLAKVIIADVRDGVYFVEEWNDEDGIAMN